MERSDRFAPKPKNEHSIANKHQTRQQQAHINQQHHQALENSQSQRQRKRERDRQRQYEQKQHQIRTQRLTQLQTALISKQQQQIDQLKQQLQRITNQLSHQLSIVEFDIRRASSEMGTALISRILHLNHECSRMTGLTSVMFGELINQATPHFQRITQEGDEKSKDTQSPAHTSDRDQLFIFLFWARQYPTLITIQSLLSIHERAVARILARVLQVLLQTLKGVVAWPTDEFLMGLKQRNEDLDQALHDFVCIVDGTRFTVKRPSDNTLQNSIYSGKTKTHNRNVLFVCLFDGTPIFVSKSFAGNRNDQGCWNETRLRAVFEGKNFGILGDKMFTFNPASEPPTVLGLTPIKRDKGQIELTEEEKIQFDD